MRRGLLLCLLSIPLLAGCASARLSQDPGVIVRARSSTSPGDGTDLVPRVPLHVRFVDEAGAGIPGVELRFLPFELENEDGFLLRPLHRTGPPAFVSDGTGTVAGSVPLHTMLAIEAVAPGVGTHVFERGIWPADRPLDLGVHTFQRGGAIEARFVDSSGAPQPGVRLVLAESFFAGDESATLASGLMSDEYSSMHWVSDRDGMVHSADLPPGFYAVAIGDEVGVEVLDELVEIVPGEVTQFRAVHDLRPIAQHEFDEEDESAASETGEIAIWLILENVPYGAFRPEGDVTITRSDGTECGQFFAPSVGARVVEPAVVPAGVVELRFGDDFGEDFPPRDPVQVRVPAGAVVDVGIPARFLDGDQGPFRLPVRVVDREGLPIEDAIVRAVGSSSPSARTDVTGLAVFFVESDELIEVVAEAPAVGLGPARVLARPKAGSVREIVCAEGIAHVEIVPAEPIDPALRWRFEPDDDPWNHVLYHWNRGPYRADDPRAIEELESFADDSQDREAESSLGPPWRARIAAAPGTIELSAAGGWSCSIEVEPSAGDHVRVPVTLPPLCPAVRFRCVLDGEPVKFAQVKMEAPRESIAAPVEGRRSDACCTTGPTRKAGSPSVPFDPAGP